MRHSAALLLASLAAATSVVLASPSAVVARTADAPEHPAALRKAAAHQSTAASARRGGLGEVIAGRYVVVLRPGHQARLRGLAARTTSYGGEVTQRYTHGLHGFAARLSASQARALADDPAVAYVEPDRVYRATGTEVDPPWGLDRIDQRSRTLNRRYAFDTTGAGVTAYIIDSGIRRTHRDLAGRVAAGYTAVKDGRGTRDCFGHGTHVAGTVGGRRYGVAKGVRLVPVRVLGCKGGGSLSAILAGINWVTANHQGSRPAVANMSLGGAYSDAMNAAVRRSVLDGVTYVVAAGNESTDACTLSPASVGSAIVVGATNPRDGRASFSDYGWCVDLFAPGVGIRSAGIRNDTASAVHDGTSMASPHVAGAAALYLQAHPSATPAQVGDALDAAATAGVGARGPGSPNRLLFSRANRVAPPPVVPPAGNVVLNPGFERGAAAWTATPGVVTDDAHAGARTGAWVAWLDGWGESHTDTLSQVVTVPATAAPRLTYWRLVATEEPADDAYDTLTTSVEDAAGVDTPLATASNLDASASWVQVSLDLTPYAGQRVTLHLTGVEDETGFTSFLVDDLYVTGQ